MSDNKLTHFDDKGRAHMVDVGEKQVSDRLAVASGHVEMSKAAFQLLKNGDAKKGDVLTISEVAAIMATKKTSELIPLCHPIPLTKVSVDWELDENLPGVKVRVTAKTKGQTGVEMEALMGASVACLTVYDMLKAVDKAMIIGPIALEEKQGGKSGSYKRVK